MLLSESNVGRLAFIMTITSIALPLSREAGVVYDVPDRRLAEPVALEASADDGAFLSAAEEAVGVLRETLKQLRVPAETASKLARQWIKIDDFLEPSRCTAALNFSHGSILEPDQPSLSIL